MTPEHLAETWGQARHDAYEAEKRKVKAERMSSAYIAARSAERRAVALADECETELRDMFAKRCGWKVSKGWFDPKRLSGGEEWTYGCYDQYFFDHPSWYKVDRKPAAIVGQPYHFDETRFMAYAEANHLKLFLPDFPSWHLPTKPRGTILVVYVGPAGLPGISQWCKPYKPCPL